MQSGKGHISEAVGIKSIQLRARWNFCAYNMRRSARSLTGSLGEAPASGLPPANRSSTSPATLLQFQLHIFCHGTSLSLHFCACNGPAASGRQTMAVGLLVCHFVGDLEWHPRFLLFARLSLHLVCFPTLRTPPTVGQAPLGRAVDVYSRATGAMRTGVRGF